MAVYQQPLEKVYNVVSLSKGFTEFPLTSAIEVAISLATVITEICGFLPTLEGSAELSQT